MALAPLVTLYAILHTADASPAITGGLGARIPSAHPSDWVRALVPVVWAAGALAMGVRLVGGHLRVRTLVRRGGEEPLAWRLLAERLAERLGITRTIRVLASTDVDVPIVIGWLRPVVLLPASAMLGQPVDIVEAILAHELSHVRRHDWLVNVLQTGLEAALFYHPAVWYVSRCLREERELACDDMVVSLLHDPIGYAKALVSLETSRGDGALLGVAATDGSLTVRVERLLSRRALSLASRSSGLYALAPFAIWIVLAAAPLLACGTSHPETLEGSRASAQDSAWLPPTVARYMPRFEDAGARHGVDPDLLAIVTLLESKGDPDAKSPYGALGLMQVMPKTAAKLTDAPISDDALLDPNVNIDLGATYLAAQLVAFDVPGDEARSVELAAAAYNAGPDRVRELLTGGRALPDETTRYKDRVVAMWKARREAR
jgi:soluble lytic murein transglycosylase-like protein